MSTLVKLTGFALLMLTGMALAAVEVVPLPPELPDFPHGHLPPPGECRIWLPEQPAGQQPPPGSCAELADEVAFHDAETLVRLESPPAAVPLPELQAPKGHLPPPGECKVWLPGQPAGHQPPPDNCAELLGEVPLGAWLIYHASPEQVVVSAYHPEVEGLVVNVGTFDVDE